MAYVTPIGRSREQVDYRLNGGHGCTPGGSGGEGATSDGDGKQPGEPRFTYRADGRERPLMWIGAGLREVGIEPGSELTPDQFDKARALLAGSDPRTGETLVAPKLAVPDDAKLSWAPLLRSIEALAAEADVTAEQFVGHGGSPAGADDPSVRTGQRQADSAVTLLRRAQRAVASKGEAGRVRADEAGVLVDWLGLDPEQVWAPGAYAMAVENLHEIVSETDAEGTVVERRQPRRVAVGNAGYDVTFTLPKSHSMLLAFAEEDTAAEVESTFMREVGRTFAWLEGTTCYGMRGQHGRGNQARTVAGTGYLGWTMVHRAARPTGGAQVGDPHWHVHLTVANMTRGQDGQWSTIAAGGRDLMRHAAAVDHVVKALTRRQLAEQFGIEFERNTRSGAWEIAGIPDETLVRFSKRQTDVHRMLETLGYDNEKVSAAQKRVAQHRTRGAKTEATGAPDATLQEIWQSEERDAGGDPAAHMDAVFGRRNDTTVSEPEPGSHGPDGAGTAPGAAQWDPQRRAALVADIAAQLQHVKTGATSHARRFTRADALWRVADACPDGIADVAELEALTDEVLAQAGFTALPTGGDVHGPNGQQRNIAAGHMANAASYTTDDVIDDETTILTTAQTVTADQSSVRVDLETAAMGMAIAEAQQGYGLSDEQTTALLRLVTEGRAVDAVEGAPGTGKTTLMSALRVVLESGGFVVRGAATAAVAAHNLQAESGIGAVTAETILRSLETGHSPLSGVDMLVLDEANLTDDRDRARLYRHARDTGTRIVEIGDAKQLRGVGVGSLFGRVHQSVDGRSLTQNRRQSDEDERAAVAAWRDGDYMGALSSWGERGHLTVTHTSGEAIAAMLASWARERRGSQDGHQQIRGLVMLAATNDAVHRLNESAQAMRRAEGELGDGRNYRVAGGSTTRLHVGDHVTLRVNDRAHHDVRGVLAGPTVLNGYRGLITAIDEAGNLTVEWEHDTGDGTTGEQAVLTPEYVARGGLSLGYAMTIHKAEGLTVGDQWSDAHGEQRGGTVLFHATGADNPGMHVASSRHRAGMQWYTSLDDITPPGESTPRIADPARRWQLAAEALADRARATEHSPDDTPVLAELWPQQYGQPAARDRDADDAARWQPEPDVDEAHTERDETDEDAERQRQEQQAAAERRAWAIALLEELWADDRAIVGRVSRARGMDRLADALASLEERRGDVRDVLTTMSRAPLGRDDLRDPAAYAARTVYATAERMDARAAAEAEWHASRDQAADLLREAWASRPQLAERVIDADAFDAVVRQLTDGVNAGFDPRDLLTRVPVETVDDAEIRNPAAFTAWAVGQAQREVAHAQQAAEPADAAIGEQLAAQLSQAARDWANQPGATEPRAERQHAPAAEGAASRAAEVNAAAAAYYRDQLEQHAQARDYLRQRLGDLTGLQQRFTLGYAPEGWRGVTDHLRAAGYADRNLVDAGISTETKDGRLIDRFRDRVLVGMHDEHGRLAGFIGRPPHEQYSPETPKYLNTPASAAFDKGRVVFGLHEQRDSLAAETATPVLVEGPFDALALAAEPATEGRIAPLATSGTAVTEAHLAAIRAHAGSDELVIALDGDHAGQAAAAKAAQHALAGGGTTRVAVLPDGHDPASWLAAHRDDPHQALQPYVDPRQQHHAGQFVADAAIDRYFAGHPEQHRDEVEGRLAAAEVAAKTLRHADLQTATHTGMHLADRLELDAGTVAGLIAEHTSRGGPAPTVLPTEPHPTDGEPAQPEPAEYEPEIDDSGAVPTQAAPAEPEADEGATSRQPEHDIAGVAEPDATPWRQREFGGYDDEQLRDQLATEQHRAATLQGQATVAEQRQQRLNEQLAAGYGPERQAVEDNLTQLRTQAEAITTIEGLESERAEAVRTASEAGNERARYEQQLAEAGPFTRKAPLEQARDEARSRETAAYHQAQATHEQIAEHEDTAGPHAQRRQVLVRAAAAEKDHPHAAEAADRRDRVARDTAHRDAQRLATRREASTQRVAGLRGELELREQQTEAQRTAEAAARLEAHAATGPAQQAPTAGQFDITSGPELGQPEADLGPPAPEADDIDPAGPEPER